MFICLSIGNLYSNQIHSIGRMCSRQGPGPECKVIYVLLVTHRLELRQKNLSLVDVKNFHLAPWENRKLKS